MPEGRQTDVQPFPESSHKTPRVSVVTVALNAESWLEQAIQSVLDQTWPDLEYIVVDGGSTDGTLNIINTYRKNIDHVISEKDEGIADAMNKGLSLATGEFVIFLQADDYFKEEGSLAAAMDRAKETTDIIACQIEFGQQRQACKPRTFNFWTNFKGIPHQGTLCRRSLLRMLNGFDKQFDICMDYDFFLRAYRAGAKLVRSPAVLTVMRDIGVSSRRDWPSLKCRFTEEKKVQWKNCPSWRMKMIYQLYWALYLPYRRVVSAMQKTADD